MNSEEGSTSLLIQDDMITDGNEEQLLKHKQGDPRARAIVLGFECMDSTASNGISNNLVVYLQTVLHGSNASSAAVVTAWYGASFFVPVVAAVVADVYLGKYKTILLSLILYLIGAILVTVSAFLVEHQVTASLCDTIGLNNILLFLGLYLVTFGSGGIRSALLPFGADQFDDRSPREGERMQEFFSWYYLCVNFGGISVIFIIWIQNNVSWALGFGISAFCIAVAFCGFVLGTPMYQLKVSRESPFKSLFQVLVCSLRDVRMELPVDTSLLYENDNKGRPKLEHTDEYRLLDKAAILLDYDPEESRKPQVIRTVTQVEELKIFLRLVPIWATGIVYSAAYFQMWTTFIQQGTAMNTEFMSISIPSAFLPSFECVCVMVWVVVYNKFVVPKMAAEPTKLQRMGIGYFLVILSMAIAAFVETRRLKSARNGQLISIAYQLPQYFIIAGSEAFSYIAQSEFFYDEAPNSMKSTCTAFSMVAISLGNYLSSLIVTLVTVLTSTGKNPGWLPDDLNHGHLDCFFWSLTCLSVVNLLVYIAFARKYRLKIKNHILELE